MLHEAAAPGMSERDSGTAEWLSPGLQTAPEPAWKVTVARAPAPEPLRPADFQLAEAFIDLMSQKLEAAGVAVQMETDFREFVKLRSGASPETPVNPTYDPSRVVISMRNAFWLRAVDSGGETVAMIAHRVFDTRDLFTDMCALRL
jgi:hypothetical protein